VHSGRARLRRPGRALATLQRQTKISRTTQSISDTERMCVSHLGAWTMDAPPHYSFLEIVQWRTRYEQKSLRTRIELVARMQ
jgi:hypothetical protein